MLKQTSISLAAVALLLSGCVTGGPKETGGTLLGGAVGALAGSQIGGGNGQLIAVAAGTMLGAFVGKSIGESLDKADQMHAQRAASSAFESGKSGQSTTWHNPDSGHSGTITPTRTYEASPGRYCREFSQTIQVGGHTEKAYGTACRQPDGSWQIVSSK